MKRNLFLLGALSLVSSLKAQFITYVGDKAGVYVKENALVYSGGGVKVVGTGVIDNSGNIMVVGDASSKFATVATDGSNKLDGGNFILRMTNKTVGSLRYGQLYINGLSQGNITGIVDKQYLDAKHGTYQQMALPFYQKQLSSLNSELGKTFGQTRWSQNEILVFNNATVVSDFIAITEKTPKNTGYFMVGAKGFDPSLSTMANQVYTVKGVPYANDITETLTGAAAGVNFGANGSATNKYRERYNSYWQDAFAITDGITAWTGDFGKNIYQYGNPFLTNLDLGQLVSSIPNIRGVRIEPSGVVSSGQGATYSTGYKFVTFAGGIAVGDTPAIIKPMQTFVIKLKDNTSQTLNFDNLRRFAYTQRALGTNYSVTAQAKKGNLGGELTTLSSNRTANNFTVSSSSTVKQLGLIALDANGVELDRTYYVVYGDAQTGQPSSASTQVAASGNLMGTFEEIPTGGIDESLSSTYWLYINEANEVTYKGKEIPMYTFSDKIHSFKVDIKENAKPIEEGASKLTSNESFYIKVGDKFTELRQGATLPVTPSSQSAYFGLYYGKPANEVLSSVEVQKPSSTVVVFDSSSNTHRVLFDQTWAKADVVVYDMSGRTIASQKDVDASTAFEIKLPAGQATYLVTAVSEKGVKFSQKIIK
ncbi:T9SS type A sorting domain-containing protein [Riemerella anatipestifer]|uniref:T9SS type A sorting domain-containing protein n=1 Tax=Riemerella anatipestifer TaxID=34085 RepID=A0AAP3AMI9_RIEAN|nr:T9SS type A sorting domain-containing protein [Riemerella anatipestifer]MCO7319346.1 T9SS type A sorting domain-containing protein [Riemerella anatipestifer]MCQ4155631.1 T9SS type A sorting domain-containing protein [Riemerella anatipestifer]MCQ4181575.1 T9SS type A sorting domain-containing protein [Riemerella anatipestifer]MCU7569078.1 T9SS type A sorting domain-containing protein [Riemerella anatipestifer]MCW0474853.1 T9SS type A sorting domain-containing protein [Riemerella anatipestife